MKPTPFVLKIPQAFSATVAAAIAGIGLLAGTLGGMLGVGGSVIIIPSLTVLLGFDQHLYQAAAMIANLAVAVPATIQHRRHHALEPRVLSRMIPPALLAVVLGVWISNFPAFRGADGGLWLGRILAVFMLYVVVMNLLRLRSPGRKAANDSPAPPITSSWRSVAVGSLAGLIAGLLGVGGGIITVPLQQVLLRLPLRNCIANSSALTAMICTIGAVYKNATLSLHHARWQDSLLLAAALSPTCWLGSRFGANLTHRLPIGAIRVAFAVLMAVAAYKMAALPWG